MMIKKYISLFFLMSLLSACATTDQQDASATDNAANATSSTSTAVSSGVDSASALEVSVEPVVQLENVFYFDYDQASLGSDVRASLDAQAAALRNSNVAIVLEGHADERGSREYNLALGERRAKAVADYLAIQGISRSRIEVVSFGEERPVALRSNSEDYALNRRVELK
ncbi:MAG: peptidoglycan-associated lipoprotein Pal [Pseudomonadota bacterium]|nr:peptidoglycan-associated lipoprotein Pal [Pseudomonadota bacterium]